MAPPSQEQTTPAGDAGTHHDAGTHQPTGADKAPDEQLPKEALRDLAPRFKELAEYISYLLSVRLDALKLTVRKAGIYAVLGVVGLLAAAGFVVTTVVLLCLGVARGLTAMFGGRAWAGDLVAGLLFVALVALAVWIGLRKLAASSRERTVRKYASRQQHQRATFGTDVAERAKEPGE